MEKTVLLIGPLILGYLLDLLLGDPEGWPHPVRVFGNLIAWGEHVLNRKSFRFIKGTLMASVLVVSVFALFDLVNHVLSISVWLFVMVNGVFVWYGLAGKNLIDEGRNVFFQLEKHGVEAGRRQLSRIVGRDTSLLSEQQVRIAVLETMSENLSDGVVAPLFYFALAGVPGMMAYKMINTMDSMLGYHNERYEWFGKFPARLDDVANFIPARLTALLMILVTRSRRGWRFVVKYGNKHKSPNAGYPEAALAGILNCRFGGANVYHGVTVAKPFIGEQERRIEAREIHTVRFINHMVCLLMVGCIVAIYLGLLMIAW